MDLLLDTHIVVAILQGNLPARFPAAQNIITSGKSVSFVSVASLWEIAIKTRLNKLAPGMELEAVPSFLQAAGLEFVAVDIPHAITAVDPQPSTRDPFDRLLLAQCQVNGLRLVTVDKALIGHRLAYKM